MKTIREYVEAGILASEDLKDALQLAMQLEFATIPPYLCAEWSVKNISHHARRTLHRVVIQEMRHFALAGNLLTAVGGTPSLAHPGFLPVYPADELPGGIPQQLPVELKPLVKEQIAVFMQIEHPDFPPVGRLLAQPPTIGAFYDSIKETFRMNPPKIDPNAHAVKVPSARPIRTVADAIETIDRIKIEGEGVPDSPSAPTGESTSHAHYYLFKELYVQRRLIKVDGEWSYSGESITLPEVHHFEPSTAEPDLSLEFRRVLTRLLIDLESCWTSGTDVNDAAMSTMFELQGAGEVLIERGIRPEFTWIQPPD
ncbi:ferritin-like protein [Streptosporangium sp. NPDC020145]|uniref:ferritin-like domain-containing protein n=1 Tax=Streptosporangium sp. NPDC020145 TaxID=3154694 RepID=UPI00341C6CFE